MGAGPAQLNEQAPRRDAWPLVERPDLVDATITSLAHGPVVIAGFAGIGKTGLATLVADRWRTGGGTAVWVSAIPAGRDVPYSAFAAFARGDATSSPDRIAEALDAELGDDNATSLLVVDDAQWLDVGAYQLVRRLADRGRRVLLTVRTGEPGADDWLALADDGAATAIALDTADRSLCEAIVAEVFAQRPTAALVDALHERSAGNLLFLRELVFAGIDSGSIVVHGKRCDLAGALPVDDDLAGAIARRLRSLDDGQLAALAAVAVLEPISDDLVTQLDAGRHVPELERRGFVAMSADGTLRISHPLLSAAARTALPATTRRRELDQVTETVLGKLDDLASDLALRLVATRVEHGLFVPSAWASAAAGRAFALLDHELAVRLGRAAVDVAPDDPEAQLVVGAALSAQFLTAEAEPYLRAAVDLARTDSQRARAAGRYGLHLGIRVGRPDEALAVMRAAHDRIDDPTWRAFLGADIGKIELMSGLGDGASVGSTDPAGADPIGRLNQAIMTALVAAASGDVALADANVVTGLELAPDHVGVLPNGADLLRLAEFIARLVAGDVDAAEELAAHELRACTTGRTEPEGLWLAMLATGALATGRPELAVERARAAIPLVAVRDFVGGMHPSTQAVLAVSLAQLGRTEDAARQLDEIDPVWLADPRTNASVLHARAWLRAAGGEPDGDAFVAAAAAASGAGLVASALPILYDAVRLGVPQAVVEPLATVAAAAPDSVAPVFHRHAVALHERDTAALAASVAELEMLGLAVFAGEAKVQLASLVEPSDRRRARWLRAEARVLVRSAGVTTSVLVDLGDSADGADAVLTDRQLQVARLAAARWRSREIADHLGLSTRTVDNLLGRTYRALGVGSRDELARVLGDGRDVPSSRE